MLKLPEPLSGDDVIGGGCGLPFAEVIGARYNLEQAGRALADVESLRVTKAIIDPTAYGTLDPVSQSHRSDGPVR